MILGLTPAIVRSISRDKRLYRVEIPGMTDGADVLPEAEIMNALGDKSMHTEVRILEGDEVYLSFQNGDPRYPVIVGYRAKRTGNPTGWRKWHHENFRIDADFEYQLEAGEKITIYVGSSIVTIDNKSVSVQCDTMDVYASSQITMNSPIISLNG